MDLKDRLARYRLLDTAAKFFRQRIQGFFSDVHEFFAFHPSPTGARARSLRVAVIILVIIAVFFAVAFVFLFVFFVVWLVLNEDIGSYRAIKGGLRRGILNVFCSFSMARLAPPTSWLAILVDEWTLSALLMKSSS